MSVRLSLSIGVSAAAFASISLPVAAQVQRDMTYHTVPPCTVVDTRVAGGAFAANETRTYSIVGSASLASQGGSPTGCLVPGFSSSTPQVQAVELAITAINPGGNGYVAANAADQPMAGSVFNMTTGLIVTNTVPVTVSQTSGVGDFKVLTAFTTTHILVRVVGYYSKLVETVWAHPVPGDAVASGANLLAALAGITNASAAKPYVLKIEPGIYDIGTTTLEMKPYVDLEGSGQQATILKGSGSSQLATSIVRGAPFTEIRDLQVQGSPGTALLYFFGISDPNAGPSDEFRIKRVTVSLSGPGTTHLTGVRLMSGRSEVSDTTITVTGGNVSVGLHCGWGTLKIHNLQITVSGSADQAHGLHCGNPMLTEADSVRIAVSGAGTSLASGLSLVATSTNPLPPPVPITNTSITVTFQNGTTYGAFFSDSDAQVSRSTIRASGPSSFGVWVQRVNNTTIDNSEIFGDSTTVFGPVRIGGSKLAGGAASGATCAGVWDENYIFSSGTCP